MIDPRAAAQRAKELNREKVIAKCEKWARRDALRWGIADPEIQVEERP